MTARVPLPTRRSRTVHPSVSVDGAAPCQLWDFSGIWPGRWWRAGSGVYSRAILGFHILGRIGSWVPGPIWIWRVWENPGQVWTSYDLTSPDWSLLHHLLQFLRVYTLSLGMLQSSGAGVRDSLILATTGELNKNTWFQPHTSARVGYWELRSCSRLPPTPRRIWGCTSQSACTVMRVPSMSQWLERHQHIWPHETKAD